MEVSLLGMGCHALGGTTVKDVETLVLQNIDAGINVFDTAECYGQSEERLGSVLGSHRQACYIFTKCGHADGSGLPDWSPLLIEKSIERSLRRLRTDYLDLVQLHSCSRKILERGEAIEALQRAKAAGKARYIGYSGDRQAAYYAVTCGAFDVLETSVNLVDQQAIDLVLPHAQARQIGIVTKRSIANAVWRETARPTHPDRRIYWERFRRLRYDFLTKSGDEIASIALRFTISIPEVDVAIVGTTQPSRIMQNKKALAQGPLPREQFEMIRKRWRAVTGWRRLLPGGRLGWQGLT